MRRSATTTWDVVDHLKTEEDMALYLEAALEDGDPVLISAALGDIARARGMMDEATAAGFKREGLSEDSPSGHDPDLATVLRVIKALGLHLRVSARR